MIVSSFWVNVIRYKLKLYNMKVNLKKKKKVAFSTVILDYVWLCIFLFPVGSALTEEGKN